MRRIFVHCGLHKTGTTALQTALMRNEDLLASRGILYPRTGRLDALGGGHHNIAWQVSRDRRCEFNAGTLDGLVAEINAFDGSAILSSEDFETILGDKILIDAFVRALASCRAEICFVIYLRQQLTYCESIFIENLAQTIGEEYPRYVRDITRTGYLSLKDWAFQFDYARMLDVVARAPVRLIVRNFHALKQRSIIADFLDIVETGLEGFEDSLDIQRNKRPPTLQALRMFYKNRVGRILGDNEQRSLKMVSELIGDRRLISKPATVAAFRAAFAGGNLAVRRQYDLPELGLDMSQPPGDGRGEVYYENIFCFELQYLTGRMRSLLGAGKPQQAAELAARFVAG